LFEVFQADVKIFERGYESDAKDENYFSKNHLSHDRDGLGWACPDENRALRFSGEKRTSAGFGDAVVCDRRTRRHFYPAGKMLVFWRKTA
jgi:hypothetical protein